MGVNGMKQEGKNKSIEKDLQCLIQTLKLYDEEIFGIGSDKEKRIVRTIQIMYREDDKRVYVRILKFGNRFNKISTTLGENIEITFGLELDSVNSSVEYFEYMLFKQKDKRINLEESIINIKRELSYVIMETYILIKQGKSLSKENYSIYMLINIKNSLII